MKKCLKMFIVILIDQKYMQNDWKSVKKCLNMFILIIIDWKDM